MVWFRKRIVFPFRQTMMTMTHRRTGRIRTAWTSETSKDYAPLFVIRGISGDTLATPIEFDPT